MYKSQNNLIQRFYNKSKGLEDSTWRIQKNKDCLIFYSLQHFEVLALSESIRSTRFSRELPKKDTLSISLYFEKNWTKNYYDSIHESNSNIIRTLSKKYLSYQDSTNWRTKSNPTLFAKDPVQYLYYWPTMNRIDRDLYHNIKKLPDTLIDDIGIFTYYISTYKSKIVEKLFLEIDTTKVVIKKLDVENRIDTNDIRNQPFPYEQFDPIERFKVSQLQIEYNNMLAKIESIFDISLTRKEKQNKY